MIKFVFVFLKLIALSNAIQHPSVSTKYWYVEKKYHLEKIKLHSDNTFMYEFEAHMTFLETQGKWHTSNNKIYLNSFDRYVSGILASHESQEEGEGFKVKIINNYGEPFAFLTIGVNHSSELGWWTTNEEGEAIIPHSKVKSVELYLITKQYDYILTDSSSNSLLLKLKPYEVGELLFRDKVFEVRKNKLIEESGGIFRIDKRGRY